MFFCLSGKGTEARGHWSVASLSGRQLQSADTCSMSRPRSKGTADVERNTSPPSPLRAEIPELSDFLSSKPGAGQNVTVNISPTASNSVFLVPAFSIHSVSFSLYPLPVAGIAYWYSVGLVVERLRVGIPVAARGRIFFSRVNFLC